MREDKDGNSVKEQANRRFCIEDVVADASHLNRKPIGELLELEDPERYADDSEAPKEQKPNPVQQQNQGEGCEVQSGSIAETGSHHLALIISLSL